MKKLAMLAIGVALVTAAIYAEDEPKNSEKKCRSLEEAYYLVGPDEVLVDGNKVCKKENAPQPRVSALEKQMPTSAPTPTPSVVEASRQEVNPLPAPMAVPTPVEKSASAPTAQLAASAEDQQPCAKVVSFGYMAPKGQGLLHYNVPDGTSKGWLNNWVRKNAQKYPDVCFLPNPLRGRTNFLVVLSNSESSFQGFQAVTSTGTTTTPVSGSGSVTDNYGGSWNYIYNGEVTTTTTTRENVPYEIDTNVLYANAYTDDGTLVSHRSHVYSTQRGGDSAQQFGYNLGNALSAINARGRLITSVLKDIAGPPQKKPKRS